MPENKEKGTYIIGYTLIWPKNADVYFDKPLIKGVLADDAASVPEGLSEFMLQGGKYIKVTEDIPNGEPGWAIEWLISGVEKETGYEVDISRQFIIKQNDYGRSYEFYVPCGDFVKVEPPSVDELLSGLKIKNSEKVNLSELGEKEGAVFNNEELVIRIDNADKRSNRPVTLKEYTLPLKIDVKAKTDSTNIRMFFDEGVLILNWECNKSELRVHDPVTGHKFGFDNGYITENTVHDISWVLNRDYMAVIIDGEIKHYRTCYEYNRKLANPEAKISAPVGICSAWGSTVTVYEMVISELE